MEMSDAQYAKVVEQMRRRGREDDETQEAVDRIIHLAKQCSRDALVSAFSRLRAINGWEQCPSSIHERHAELWARAKNLRIGQVTYEQGDRVRSMMDRRFPTYSERKDPADFSRTIDELAIEVAASERTLP